MFTYTATTETRDLVVRFEQLRTRLDAGATLPRR